MMIRIAVTLCFCLTLLCPVFCLASSDGDCPDHPQETGRNCEAMSVGAVVAEFAAAPACPLCLPLSFDLWVLIRASLEGPRGRSAIMALHRPGAKPLAAAVRQSLLQVFLF